MRFVTIVWNDTEGGNVRHIAEHGLMPDEVDDVLQNPESRFIRSDSTGRPIALGWTSTGKHILVAFEEIDDMTVFPVTAYEVPEWQG